MKLSKRIATCSMAAVLSGVLVTLGNSVPIIDYSCFMLASMALWIPIFNGDVVGCFLTLIASSIIGALLMPNFMVMIPYVVFFAPYILVSGVLWLKKVKKPVEIIAKLLFFSMAAFALYKLTQIFIEVNMLKLPVFVLFIGAIALMIIYDLLLTRIRGKAQFLYNKHFLRK